MNDVINSREAAVPASRRSGDGLFRLAVLLLLAVIAGLLALQVLHELNDKIDPATLRTDYQAVLLNNGLVYFGKVDNVNGRFLTMTDVYYVQMRAAAAGAPQKQSPNVLIKRGSEWHAPDRMTINLQDIVFIEPVTPNSTVS